MFVKGKKLNLTRDKKKKKSINKKDLCTTVSLLIVRSQAVSFLPDFLCCSNLCTILLESSDFFSIWTPLALLFTPCFIQYLILWCQDTSSLLWVFDSPAWFGKMFLSPREPPWFQRNVSFLPYLYRMNWQAMLLHIT